MRPNHAPAHNRQSPPPLLPPPAAQPNVRFQLRQSQYDPGEYSVYDTLTGHYLSTGSLRVSRAMNSHLNFSWARELQLHGSKALRPPPTATEGPLPARHVR